ncbi:hypothetical protein [Paenibacillus qinlingensis]|uniref:hypothetical protein n=1 Tax=Paenibacillus qinlingensis TaxID=1837343 RepID=UPI001567172B|nr:hypothetical protein [Paenibacillus qinlingensis]NQX57530.1 hypothetical protein [Paenibacillus qinlingensis]
MSATMTEIKTTDSEVMTERWDWPNPGDICGYTGYKTNKFDLKQKVENGGWIVAWSDDISETDAIQGVVAAGVSVVSSNPGPFLLWIEQLVERTISSLASDAKQKFTDEIRKQVNELAADVIKRALQGKDASEALKQFDTLDVKAGAIKYSGKNVVCGNTVTTTWGMKPYIAFRLR